MKIIKLMTVCVSAMFLSGCFYFWNVLPNKTRDDYYATHGPSFQDHVYKVYHGMAKEEVVNILGEPNEIKKNGVWIYHFPDDWVSTFYIKFKDDKVIKRWG